MEVNAGTGMTAAVVEASVLNVGEGIVDAVKVTGSRVNAGKGIIEAVKVAGSRVNAGKDIMVLASIPRAFNGRPKESLPS